jgi:hypothetical protein
VRPLDLGFSAAVVEEAPLLQVLLLVVLLLVQELLPEKPLLEAAAVLLLVEEALLLPEPWPLEAKERLPSSPSRRARAAWACRSAQLLPGCTDICDVMPQGEGCLPLKFE